VASVFKKIISRRVVYRQR